MSLTPKKVCRLERSHSIQLFVQTPRLAQGHSGLGWGLQRKARYAHPSRPNNIIVSLHQLGYLWPEPGSIRSAYQTLACKAWAAGGSGDRGSQTRNRTGWILPGRRAQTDSDSICSFWVEPDPQRRGQEGTAESQTHFILAKPKSGSRGYISLKILERDQTTPLERSPPLPSVLF